MSGNLPRRIRVGLEAAIDEIDVLCTGIEWNIDNHPAIMNQSDAEALTTARGIEKALRKLLAEPVPPLKRYSLDKGCGSMFEQRHGMWVKYSDVFGHAAGASRKQGEF